MTEVTLTNEPDPVEEAREAYRRYRRMTRPFRRAFDGDMRTHMRLNKIAWASWNRDAQRVREAVILGSRDIPTIATRIGLGQGRVRRIVKGEGIRTVVV